MDDFSDESFYQALQGLISRNGPQVCHTALEILNKLLTNILSNPQENKFRAIKKTNKVISEKLMRCVGIDQILSILGYQDSFTEPDTFVYMRDLDRLDLARTILEATISELSDSLISDEEKERRVKATQRKQQEIKDRMRRQEEDKKLLLEQARLARLDTQARPPASNSAPKPATGKSGCTARTFKDIGVDLNAQRRG
jgi:hypothetical protein